MKDKFYITPVQYIDVANHEINDFPVLMAERHRKRFLEYIEDITNFNGHPDCIGIDTKIDLCGKKYSFYDIQKGLVRAESNEYFIGSCLRLEMGYNIRIGLTEGSPVVLLKPILENLKRNFRHNIEDTRMLESYYVENIAPKYPPEFFTFSKEDIARLLILREIGK